MEIIDYLRIARRRWWILVLVPVLAGAVSAALILLAPPSYTATATVNAGSLVGSDGSPFTGTQGVTQFVAAFTAAAQNPQTRAAVLKATGVTPSAQADGIEVDPVGASSDMQVSFTSGKRDVAAAVAQTTAKQALALMFTVRADQAAATRDRAQQSATEANAAIDTLAKKYQIADPPRAYQTQLNQVAALQQQQANLRAAGNAIGAAAMDAPIAQAKTDLAAYLPILAEYNDLASRQVAASNDLTQAQAEWRHAVSLQAAAVSDSAVYLGPTSTADKQATLVATLPPIIGAGLFLAVVLVLLLEVFKRIRANQAASARQMASDADPEADDVVGAEGTRPVGAPHAEATEGHDRPEASRVEDPELDPQTASRRERGRQLLRRRQAVTGDDAALAAEAPVEPVEPVESVESAEPVESVESGTSDGQAQADHADPGQDSADSGQDSADAHEPMAAQVR